MCYLKRFILTTALLLLLSHTSIALQYYFAADIPVEFGTVSYQTNQVIQSLNGGYSLFESLSSEVQIGAMHVEPNGILLFSPTAPAYLGTQQFEPRDIIGFDGDSYFAYLRGQDIGIPPEARIDALMMDVSDRPVLSLDIPVDVSSGTLHPSDLATVNGTTGLTLYWDAQAAGVPSEANLVGAELDAGDKLILSFDIPVFLSGTEYNPGDLVQWIGGSSFAHYASDSNWPPEARVNDFAFATPAGAVPNVLMVTKAGANIVLNWTSSCGNSDSDYEVYEGAIGNYYSHHSLVCTTGGSTNHAFALQEGNTYYLIVPRNATAEGSYGHSSDGSERPQGFDACASQVVSCSP